MRKKKRIKLERILQISNDVAEDMNTHSVSELKETILYWMNEHSHRINENNQMRGVVRLAGLKLLASVAPSYFKPKKTKKEIVSK